MPPFKPLTSTKTSLQKDQTNQSNQLKAFESLKEIQETTEERIFIIYDDSGSMATDVYERDDYRDRGTNYGSRIKLAAQATTDYMKNCAPYKTAIEIQPLNESAFSLTKNLPVLSAKLLKLEA